MPDFYNLPNDEPATNYQSGQVTVGTTATLICSVEGNESGVLVNNGATALFLGGPTVTTANGFPVPINTTINVPTYGGAKVSLYGVVASTTSVVSFLHPTA